MSKAKTILATVGAAVLVGAGVFLSGVSNTMPGNAVEPSGNNSVQLPRCDDSLWKHVYAGDPRRFKTPQDRLKVITPCITVTGTLVDKKSEADGDEHIQLALDAPFTHLLNAKNMSDQAGHLVIEPTCMSVPTQKDAVAEGVCKGWHNPLVIPPMGTRVSVTGPLVLDNEHGWQEIHPPSSLEAVK